MSAPNRPIEIYVSGSYYPQIKYLVDEPEKFIFRNERAYNSDNENNLLFDYYMPMCGGDRHKVFGKHPLPYYKVLDYSILDKVEQFEILSKHFPLLDNNYQSKPVPGNVYLLPTASVSNNLFGNYSWNYCKAWDGIDNTPFYNSKNIVIQSANSANGWNHILTKRSLIGDVLLIATTDAFRKLKETFGNHITITEPRKDTSEGSYFSDNVIVRPYLEDIDKEYRIIYSKNAEGKLHTALSRIRVRKLVGGNYRQANITRMDDPEFTSDLIVFMNYSELTDTDNLGNHSTLYSAVKEIVQHLPCPFGAIDLAVTSSGQYVVLEFSPEFGMSFTDELEISKMAKQAFVDAIKRNKDIADSHASVVNS